MTAVLTATVGHGSSALWYLTRATGLVSLILLTATVVLGTVASVGWTTDRWPRFLSQSVHRNISLFCLALIGVHIVSTVGDGYVPIGLADAVIPFRSTYRPIWVGLGALAFDMLLAVAITSALRRRIGVTAWRGVHWLAYACWPIAVVHGLGAGSDTKLPGALLIIAGCIGSVAAAAAWRLAVGRARSVTWRLGGVLAGSAVLLTIVTFAVVGPLRPGWSHRAGTSPALLAQLAGSATASGAGGLTGGTPTSPPGSPVVPTAPFTTSVTGTFTTSGPNADGDSVVSLHMTLGDATAPLLVQIIGPASDGGVQMRRSAVTLGPLAGQVTALNGSSLGAVVRGPTGSLDLTLNLSLDPSAGSLTGQISGASAQ